MTTLWSTPLRARTQSAGLVPDQRSARLVCADSCSAALVSGASAAKARVECNGRSAAAPRPPTANVARRKNARRSLSGCGSSVVASMFWSWSATIRFSMKKGEACDHASRTRAAHTWEFAKIASNEPARHSHGEAASRRKTVLSLCSDSDGHVLIRCNCVRTSIGIARQRLNQAYVYPGAQHGFNNDTTPTAARENLQLAATAVGHRSWASIPGRA